MNFLQIFLLFIFQKKMAANWNIFHVNTVIYIWTGLQWYRNRSYLTLSTIIIQDSYSYWYEINFDSPLIFSDFDLCKTSQFDFFFTSEKCCSCNFIFENSYFGRIIAANKKLYFTVNMSCMMHIFWTKRFSYQNEQKLKQNIML